MLFDRVVPCFFDVTDDGVGVFVEVFKRPSKEVVARNRFHYLKNKRLVEELKNGD